MGGACVTWVDCVAEVVKSTGIWFDHHLRGAKKRSKIFVEIVLLLSRLRCRRRPEIDRISDDLVEINTACTNNANDDL